MYKLIFNLIIAFILLFSFVTPSLAQEQVDPQEYFAKGEVQEVLPLATETINTIVVNTQEYRIKLLDGIESGKMIIVKQQIDSRFSLLLPNAGDIMVISSRVYPVTGRQYGIYEPYRLNLLVIVSVVFVVFVVLIAGLRGLGALVGLGISLFVIIGWIVPQILSGQDPLQITIMGACVILVVTTYIAHGISLKTTVAIVSTAIAFFVAAWLSTTMVSALKITGFGNEDIYTLQMGMQNSINPKGLLLSGILIGTLGALNDITTTQAITIFTFVKENPKQKMHDLYLKGMTIGQEHIASLINTLVLAYAGSSIAVLIFFSLNPLHMPWWVVLNNETTIEEILKALVGSSVLIMAVPITTFLATWVALRGTTIRTFLKSFS